MLSVMGATKGDPKSLKMREYFHVRVKLQMKYMWVSHTHAKFPQGHRMAPGPCNGARSALT